ncbi:DUF1553 domain-containing protein [Phragmitibacter flavus]|uniref:DUF1553 domain-containing protein n=1 Tax=Phragmitibacter flavus TaxID=2576071 RepID=A0A5R8K9P8_9BACT|nr:DUF1553 domain-containing protein [Phragmitibacter flavus]TLD68249.1 DUF1553 domain-containing protein [Phragmitibacter flavus]
MRLLTVLFLTLAAPLLSASEPAPVASWNFDDTSKDTPGTWLNPKKPAATTTGPRSPRYANFPEKNTALTFPGKGTDTSLIIKDNGPDGPQSLQFKKGDPITLEAWIKPSPQLNGEAYIIAKGRHSQKGFHSMNQNYGLRVKNGDKGVRIGFIFSSHDGNNKNPQWHVWWSDDKAYEASSAWHHIAITYTFGVADSLKGYIDGKLTTGTWTFAGPTDRAPVTDTDDLKIGTALEGKPGNSYNGDLDAVAIQRAIIPPADIQARYAFTPAPPPVVDTDLIPGKVLVQIAEENVPASRAWPEDNPTVATTYTEDVFGFFEIPHKYISTGIRADRSPALVRATAKVDLPAGKHRLLLRARGGARLYIDGQQTLTTPFPKGDTGGHGVVADQDTYLNLGPDFRFAPPGNRESTITFESKGGQHLVLLETIIGSSGQRPELGETVIAISPEGSQHWHLLSPGDRRVPYTDAGWAAYEAERRPRIEAMNTAERNRVRAQQNPYWEKRRAAAAAWLASTKDQQPAVPALPSGYTANNPIDHFIAARIADVALAYQAIPSGGVDFHREVQPILETKCFSCHQGGKVKGGLWLDSLKGLLTGGDEEGPAIIKGKPADSPLIHRITTDDDNLIMPPKGDRLTADEVAILEKWIAQGASWPEFKVANLKPTDLSTDLHFLRRVTLDTTGVVPSEAEVNAFLADTSKDKRAKVIDRLLADPRWADHWVSYWQDVLAENPNIINPTLNNTGPFRWWIYESLLDNKPIDLFATELIRLEGSNRYGGPNGFGTATQNDAPMAEKGAIVASAFLGVEMKCARCHDAPAHISLQKDLFQLAAMLSQESVKVPTTSSVPMDKLHEGGRKPLIKVTLAPGSIVEPDWPFTRYADPKIADQLVAEPDNTRDRLAALVTAPQNERFAQVIVNRLWQRLMGRGLVDNVADWEKGGPTHPELLTWLARDFVRNGYDLKSTARLILNTHAYQRATDPTLNTPSPLHIAPAPRRLNAEQIVDSLFAATGKPFNVEEVSLDLDGNRSDKNSITLGKPNRSWMLASTSNERDRPSLTLPRLQAVATVLEAFGWRGARQDPISIRDSAPNTLQPAILSNGTMGYWLTTLSDDHGITQLALEDQPLDKFINRLYLRLLTREPTAQELASTRDLLQPGYDKRSMVPVAKTKETVTSTGERKRPYYFTWSNHLDGIANTLGVEAEERARQGDPPTEKLNAEWRQRLEDLLWSLLNRPEWLFSS